MHTAEIDARMSIVRFILACAIIVEASWRRSPTHSPRVVYSRPAEASKSRKPHPLPGSLAANVSAVSDVPEPGEARRRHVRRLSMTNLHETTCGGKAARTRGRCAK
jgi:hypothetical protein